jgi:predicted CoA-binding protein
VINEKNVIEYTYYEKDNILHVVYAGGTETNYYPVNPETYAAMIAGECLSKSIHHTTRKLFIVGVNRRLN